MACDAYHRQAGPAALGCDRKFESVQRWAEIDVRDEQRGCFDPIEQGEDTPPGSKSDHAQTAIVEYLRDDVPHGGIRLHKNCPGHGSVLSSGQPVQRIENSIGPRINGYR